MTDGTKTEGKKSLRTKKLVPFIWIQSSQTPGMFGRGKRGVAGFQYHFTPHCCKKKFYTTVEEPYKLEYNRTCLTHCLYCFSKHKSCTPQYQQKKMHTQTHMLTSTHSLLVITEQTHTPAPTHTHTHPCKLVITA